MSQTAAAVATALLYRHVADRADMPRWHTPTAAPSAKTQPVWMSAAYIRADAAVTGQCSRRAGPMVRESCAAASVKLTGEHML